MAATMVHLLPRRGSLTTSALIVYATKPSGASLSKHSVIKSARQGGVTRPLVPAPRNAPVEKENVRSDSREGSPTPRLSSVKQQVGCAAGRLGKREAALAEETDLLLVRMEGREKRTRAASVRTRQLV